MKPYGDPNSIDRDPEYYGVKIGELGRKYKPKMFPDGKGLVVPFCCYCCGPNIIEGIGGCGDTPQEAYDEWERQMKLRWNEVQRKTRG